MPDNLKLPSSNALAQAIYDLNPARQPWDGDKFEFGDSHWAAKDSQDLAKRQADAVLRLIQSAN